MDSSVTKSRSNGSNAQELEGHLEVSNSKMSRQLYVLSSIGITRHNYRGRC